MSTLRKRIKGRCKFCDKCGAGFGGNDSTSATVNPANAKKKIYKRWYFWVIIVVAIMIVGGVNGAINGNSGSNKSKQETTVANQSSEKATEKATEAPTTKKLQQKSLLKTRRRLKKNLKTVAKQSTLKLFQETLTSTKVMTTSLKVRLFRFRKAGAIRLT